MKGRVLVVDCSVLVKLLGGEGGVAEAARLFRSRDLRIAPDLLLAEFGNVLWKKVRRGHLTPEEALEVQGAMGAIIPLRILPSALYQRRALEVALDLGVTFYDALYLAMAEAEGAVLVTADAKLIQAVRGSGLENRVRSLDDGWSEP